MWSYDPAKRTTGDGNGIIPRTRLEEAADVLYLSGIRNQLLIVDVLKVLSGLGRGEVRSTVDLAVEGLEREGKVSR